ncbi:MAG: tRNA (guanosine(46)-N7)-methyltransferase TrmB [Oceanococcaceae bacterium]
MADSHPDRAGVFLRRIHTFVRREGRCTAAQARALETLLPSLQWPAQRSDPVAVFGRDAPLTLEIGFGAGDNLLAQCQAQPELNFFGLEVHRPGVGQLLHRAHEVGIRNLRVSTDDALEVLDERLPAASVDCLQIWFPDPWHKTRHHKRRIIQPQHLDRFARVLRPGAELRMATDWEEYAEWMRTHCEAHPAFRNVHGPGAFAPRCSERIRTRFEQRGERLGHVVRDLVYRREPRPR